MWSLVISILPWTTPPLSFSPDYSNPAMHHPSSPLGKKNSGGGSWQYLNHAGKWPWDLHVYPLPIMLTYADQPLTHGIMPWSLVCGLNTGLTSCGLSTEFTSCDLIVLALHMMYTCIHCHCANWLAKQVSLADIWQWWRLTRGCSPQHSRCVYVLLAMYQTVQLHGEWNTIRIVWWCWTWITS